MVSCLIVYLCLIFVFFFKQKTAYEMRISDWSSDVCSSDLMQSQDTRLRYKLCRRDDAFRLFKGAPKDGWVIVGTAEDWRAARWLLKDAVQDRTKARRAARHALIEELRELGIVVENRLPPLSKAARRFLEWRRPPPEILPPDISRTDPQHTRRTA